MRKIAVYAFIFVLAVIQYAGTWNHDYAWDDAIVITQNERVQKGFEGIPEVFKNIKSDEIQHRYGYRPISLMSFAIDYGLFGDDPHAGHVVNTLFYGMLCCLLFFVLLKLFPERTPWMAFLITALFVVHPVHTEVVANIKSRDEMLAMVFGLLAILAFLKVLDADRKKVLNALLVVVLLILSFFSRENGIVFSGLLLLIAYYKHEATTHFALKWGLPVFSLVVLMGIRWVLYSDYFFENRSTALIAQGKFIEDGFIGNPLQDATGILQILPNSFYILAQNLRLLIFPSELVHDYAFGHTKLVGWSNPLVIFSVLFHLFLGYVVVRNFKKRTLINFGILFYFISVFIYLHLIQVGPDYMAERYLFLPSVGFLIALFGVFEWATKGSFLRTSPPFYTTAAAKGAIVLLGIFFLLGFAKTSDRNKAWENNKTLMETDVEVATECARLHYNYACLLHTDYYKSPSPTKQTRILEHYQKAVDISNRSMKAQLDLGRAYMEFGQPDKGKEVFLQCIETYPELSIPYIEVGKYYLSKNQFTDALTYFEKAKEKGKENSDVYYLNAVCYVMLQKNEMAREELEAGLPYQPVIGKYFDLLGDLYFFEEKMKESRENLTKAMTIEPANAALKTKFEERFGSNK